MAQKSEASRERGLPHTAETSEELRGTKIHRLHTGKICAPLLTSHPSPPWAGARSGELQALLIHPALKPTANWPKLLLLGPDASPSQAQGFLQWLPLSLQHSPHDPVPLHSVPAADIPKAPHYSLTTGTPTPAQLEDTIPKVPL